MAQPTPTVKGPTPGEQVTAVSDKPHSESEGGSGKGHVASVGKKAAKDPPAEVPPAEVDDGPDLNADDYIGHADDSDDDEPPPPPPERDYEAMMEGIKRKFAAEQLAKAEAKEKAAAAEVAAAQAARDALKPKYRPPPPPPPKVEEPVKVKSPPSAHAHHSHHSHHSHHVHKSHSEKPTPSTSSRTHKSKSKQTRPTFGAPGHPVTASNSATANNSVTSSKGVASSKTVAGRKSKPAAVAAVKESNSKDLSALPLFQSSSTTTKSGVKMDKNERKAAKKLSKMMAIVASQMGAEKSPLPTEWTVIWGAGLGLGTPKSTIMQFFTPAPVDVRFYVGKPYCAAKFASTMDATVATEGKSGKEIYPSQPLYIGFLGEDPPAEDISVLDSFDKKWPVGLSLIPDFITEEEEENMLNTLLPDQFLKAEWKDGKRDTVAEMKKAQREKSTKRDILADIKKAQREKDGTLKNRTVLHFGYEFRYTTNDVDFDKPMKDKIPEYMLPLIVRMMKHNLLFRKPEQVTMNHYQPGQGIPPHVDTHSAFEAPIISLSMAGPVVMEFRDGEETVSVQLPRRSLLVMNEEARLLWTHGIAGRSFDVVRDPIYGGLTAQPRQERVSLTFRLLNRGRVCICPYPQMCDSQKAKISQENASELERDLVHQIYESIAPHFSATRYSPWPKVRDFLESLDPGQTMLDVGCGNGKYFNLTDYIYQVGTDMSQGLLEISQTQKSVDGVRSNCLQLAFRDESFDALICIAVLHHLSTKERRLEALREIVRVLIPKGQALIYVWAKTQRLKEVKSNYARQRSLKAGRDGDEKSSACMYPLRDYAFLPVHDHSDDFQANDMLVPWISGGRDGTVEHRFYHVFDRGELEGLIQELEIPPQISDSYYDQGNWCVRIQKHDPLLFHQMTNSKHLTFCDDD